MNHRGWRSYQRDNFKNEKQGFALWISRFRFSRNRWGEEASRSFLIRVKALFVPLLILFCGLVLLGWFSSNHLFEDPFLEPLVKEDKGPRTHPNWKGIEVGPVYIGDSWVRFKNDFQPQFNQVQNNQFITPLPDGVQISYSLDVNLQKKIKKVMSKHRLPYGMVVALEPKTGRVLDMVDYSRTERVHKNLNLRASYPAASIFKLITAAAALDQNKVSPETRIAFHGGNSKLGAWNWKENPRRDRDKISIKYALAKSCNVAFAKVALRWLGDQGLKCYAESFWFNKPIPFEFPVEVSRAVFRPDEASIAYTAAGLGEVGLSPLHGAMIASAIANGGVMMVPQIVEKITWENGEAIYTHQEQVLTQVISPQTAQELKEMMAYTVTRGTSRKAFHTRRGTPYIKGISIGGKTGSLRGKEPKGQYSWFVGMAPLEDPEIALAVVIINKPIWQIKASHLAKEAFKEYFKTKKTRKVAKKRGNQKL